MTKNIKILIIDDEIDTLDFISYQLQNAGFEVKTALHGRLALEVLKTFEPRLILVDFMMPNMNGEEFIRALRSIEKLKDLPVFISSGISNLSQIYRGIGANGFIKKPIGLEDLEKAFN